MQKTLNNIYIYIFIIWIIISLANSSIPTKFSFFRSITIINNIFSIILLTSTIYLIPNVYKGPKIALFIFCIYTLIIDLTNNMVSNIPVLPFLFCSFMIFSETKSIIIFKKNIKIFFSIFVILILLKEFFYSGPVHDVYFILALLPFIYLEKKRNLYIAVIIILTALSLKRAAFLTSIICYGVIILCETFLLKKNFKRFMGFVIITSIIFAFLSGNNEMTKRLHGIYEDGGSGRDLIYENTIQEINNSSTNHILWGHGGFNSVMKDNIYMELSAHNDFIEIIYDYGLIGLALYLFFIYHIIKLCINSRKISIDYFIAMLVSLIIFVIISSFSMFIFNMRFSCLIFAFWGFVYSSHNIKYNKNKYAYTTHSFDKSIF